MSCPTAPRLTSTDFAISLVIHPFFSLKKRKMTTQGSFSGFALIRSVHPVDSESALLVRRWYSRQHVGVVHIGTSLL